MQIYIDRYYGYDNIYFKTNRSTMENSVFPSLSDYLSFELPVMQIQQAKGNTVVAMRFSRNPEIMQQRRIKGPRKIPSHDA
jgi:hypothetical protein